MILASSAACEQVFEVPEEIGDNAFGLARVRLACPHSANTKLADSNSRRWPGSEMLLEVQRHAGSHLASQVAPEAAALAVGSTFIAAGASCSVAPS